MKPRTSVCLHLYAYCRGSMQNSYLLLYITVCYCVCVDPSPLYQYNSMFLSLCGSMVNSMFLCSCGSRVNTKQENTLAAKSYI